MKISRSYPYLSIAKHFGVDYGDVLLVAQYRAQGDSRSPNTHEWGAIRRVTTDVNLLVFKDFAAAIDQAIREFRRIQKEGWD
ncbi:hypothetical protein [Nitratireductor sp. OM-1]|uniref:hypothetical protein n=1 Tax=Nitratireductor sp. OM-1 TaxID=1756988 RepID=UPI000DE0BA19|nr:hypothetical protein [Nitratireductor sp. OM-1]